MTISDKSIIEPEEQKPGIPIKKSTIAVIAGLVVTAAFVSALLMDSGNSERPQSVAGPTVSGEEKQPSGTKTTIDEELKKAKEAVEQEERRAAAARGEAPKPTASATPHDAASRSATTPASPLPPGVRRDNQDAALYEKTMRKGSKPAPAGSAVTGNQRGGDGEFESEAQARSSKSLAFDDGAGSMAPMGGVIPAYGNSQPQMQRVGGLPDLAPAPAPPPPSASMQPMIDKVMSAMNGQGQQKPGGNSNSAWLNEYATTNQKTNDAIKSYPTASRFTLHQGKVIPAVLGRTINSDLPGDITAYVITDVYDSMGNGSLLIPKGAVLVGRYSSELKMGQERVLFAFNRIILPNGNSFDLPAAQGTDAIGASGIKGDVDNHFWKMFSASFFTAWLADRAAQPANVTVIGGGSTNTSPAGQVLVDVSRTILDRNKNIQPTITVEKGTRINIDVKKDMEFASPYNRSAN